MLSRLRAPRLCHACRTHLLAIFHATSREPSKPRSFPVPFLKSTQQTNATRPFSNSRLCHGDVEDVEPISSSLSRQPVTPSRATALHNEAASRDSRKPSSEFQDGRLAQESAEDTPVAPEWPEQSTLNQVAQESLAALRLSGASLESIVREVRHIFGESLPEGVLKKEEFKLYRRLYDDPVQGISEDGEEPSDPAEIYTPDIEKPVQLLGDDGHPVNYSLDGVAEQEIGSVDVRDLENKPRFPESPVAREQSPTEPDSSINDQVQKIAEQLGGEVYDADEVDPSESDQEAFSSDQRAHPLTSLGRFATYPRTVYLPQEAVIKPVEHILSDYSNKQLKEVCERRFGGGGLPDSPLTPRSGRTMPQIPVPLSASQHSMGEMEANAFMTVVMPSTYAAANSVLVEIRKRLGSSWLRSLLAQEGGPRILDAGAGGAGILAWREIVRAEWEALHSSDRNTPPAPLGKAIVLTGSDALRHRSAALLENTTFIPRLPDYIHIRDTATLEDDRPAPTRKEFNVIIASHTLWPLKEEWERKQQVQNLWSLLDSDGGVLILIEKGVPRGFEAIAGAREQLLKRYIASPDSLTYDHSLDSRPSDDMPQTHKGKGMIVAPCTNHSRCPMYPVAGMSRGRKDYCSFQQRYVRPQYLQRILGAKDRSHDDVDFSYISVLKGKDLRDQTAVSFGDLEDPSSAPQTSTSVRLTPDEATNQAFEGFEQVERPLEVKTDSAMAIETTESAGELPSLHDMPRLIYPPLKRRGHVTLDVCTPAGKIERWTVPKSYSKQAYRDARKSNWGDLWALGAKTRVARNLRLGGPGTKEGEKARKQKNMIVDKEAELIERMEEESLADMEEMEEFEEVMGTEFDEMTPSTPHEKKQPISAVKRQQQALVEDEADSPEDVYVTKALAEWEEEFEQDKQIGRKSVRSVRDGTKVKRQNRRPAPVWEGRRNADIE